ncbi:MAG: transglutaminase domain-containing protein [Treponema sp.]
MNFSSSFNYFFRKSPLVRAALWAAFAVLFTGILFFFGSRRKVLPEIQELKPPVGAPGDTVIINGRGFGETKDTGSVDFGGSSLTARSYVSWADDRIKIVLPPDIQDGFVIVRTKYGRSNSVFFANANAAPVAVAPNKGAVTPVITGFTPQNPLPGGEFTITGMNFGNTRDKSHVFFSVRREERQSQTNFAENSMINEDMQEYSSFIPCSQDDFDYEYWSDNEIRVRIPDGAVSGGAYVQTARGRSAEIFVKVDAKAGIKNFISPKTYLIQTAVDVDDSANGKDASVVLRCPYPWSSASQPAVRFTGSNSEPVLSDYRHTIIYQVRKDAGREEKKRFSQDFMIYVYETRTDIAAARLGKKDGISAALYAAATRSDTCVPSDDEAVRALLSGIIGKETSAYAIASLVYNYMTENFTAQRGIRSAPASPLDLLKTKRGDAYDFAVIFTALLRAAGIPALPDSGILVGADMKTQTHWWSEFYLSGFGWVPVDAALGAGLEYHAWQKDADDFDAKKYYFGNLDAQHILFSRGWNEIKPSSPQNRTVTRQRTFALQSIWEEASGKDIEYSSYWAEPVVTGVY